VGGLFLFKLLFLVVLFSSSRFFFGGGLLPEFLFFISFLGC
jgi:hypothetical protein